MTRRKLFIFTSLQGLYNYTKNIDTYYFQEKTMKGIYLAKDPDASLILTELGQQIRIL